MFRSLSEARRIVEAWRIDYNTVRPLSSFGGLAPSVFANRPSSEVQLKPDLTDDRREIGEHVIRTRTFHARSNPSNVGTEQPSWMWAHGIGYRGPRLTAYGNIDRHDAAGTFDKGGKAIG